MNRREVFYGCLKRRRCRYRCAVQHTRADVIGFDRARMVVIEPSGEFAPLLQERGIRHLQVALTAENFAEVLSGLIPDGKGMIVNLSVDVDSIELMKLAQAKQHPSGSKATSTSARCKMRLPADRANSILMPIL